MAGPARAAARGAPAHHGRALVLLAALIPAAAVLSVDPWHFLRFSSLKAPCAWLLLLWGNLILVTRLRRRPAEPLRLTAPAVLGCSLLLWSTLTLTWSPSPGRGELQLWHWGMALPWAALLALLPRVVPEPLTRLRSTILAGWLLTGALCALLALVQRTGALELGLHRVTSTVGNPNRLAAVLLLCLPAARQLLRCGAPRNRPWVWLAAALCSAALLATGCAGALIGLALMGLWWVGGTPIRHRRRWALLLLLLAGAVASLATTSSHMRSALLHSARGRALIQGVAATVWGSAPLRGVGLGGFTSRALPLQGDALRAAPDISWSNLRDAHSLPLGLASETGLVGLGLLVLLLVWLGATLVRRRQDPTAADVVAALIGLGVHSLSDSAHNSASVILLATGWLVLGSWREQERSTDVGPPPGHAMTRAALVPLLLLCAAGTFRTTQQATADRLLARGLSLMAAGQTTAAARPLRGAARLALDQTEADFYAATLLDRTAGAPLAARLYLARSCARAPTPERATAMGNLDARSGNLRSAASWYHRAIRLHPRYTPAYNNLGVVLLRQGHAGQARRVLRRARSLRPGDHRIQRNWSRRQQILAATPSRTR